MKARLLLGILLIGLGVAGLIYREFTYQEKEKTVNINEKIVITPPTIKTSEQKSIHFSPWLSAGAIAGGVLLILISKNNNNNKK